MSWEHLGQNNWQIRKIVAAWTPGWGFILFLRFRVRTTSLRLHFAHIHQPAVYRTNLPVTDTSVFFLSFSPDYYDWGHQNNSFMAYIGSLQQDPALDTDRPSPI